MKKMAQSPFLDSLLCHEDDDQLYNDYLTPAPNTLCFQHHDLFWENEELIALFSKEKQSKEKNPEKLGELMTMREKAINWIMGVVDYYSFSRITAVLAVDYFDRFFSATGFEHRREQENQPWMMQLVAVASLSIAAKVEETRVPLLLDLQVEESSYVFEAKTIQKMEILVLSTLEWKMNPVTPISFIDHFSRRLGFEYHFCCEFLDRCECLIVSLISDSWFMRFLPSVLATATMLHIINALNPSFKTEYQNQILNSLKIDKDQLDDCFKLISDSKNGVLGFKSNKRKIRSAIPESPNGVIDVCFSSDCSNDSWISPPAAATASPEPRSKKIRALFYF